MLNLTRRIAVFSAIALVISLGSVWAQSDRGTITGTVVDSSGARVAGAAVQATNVSTGITNSQTTGSSGDYTIPLLAIGKYRVTVEHPGFKKFVQDGITLNTGLTVTVDISLQLGNVTETVQVTGEPPQLQTDTTSLSTTANGTLVSDLPLFGQSEMRNPGFFMVMDSSVSSRGNSFGGGGGFNDRSLSTTVAGAPSASAEFHVDGSILGDAGQVHADFRLIGFPADAVQEFTLYTIGIPAEIGHSGGGVTAFTIKSGGNQLHGSAYEYLRNNDLDTRGFFASTVAPLRQNEFGANAGGRIIKDKLFFFGWYDGFRISAGASSQLQTVPTQQMLQGNFSAFTAGIGPGGAQAVVPIYDPATTTESGSRTQFTGNVIPTNRFDKVASQIAGFFPAPSGPNASSDINNFLEQGTNKTSQNEWGGKIQYQMTTKSRLSGSFSYSNENTDSGYNPFPAPLSETGPSINKLPVVRLSDDYLVAPNVVNHITLGFNRWASLSEPVGSVAGGWPAKLGYGGLPFTDGAMPIFNIASGIPQFGGGGGNPSGSTLNNFDFNESLTWIKGKHTAKFGMEFLRTSQNSISTGRASGYLYVNAQETGEPGTTGFGTDNGIGFASFILGQVDSGMVNYYFAPDDGGRGGYWAGYAQDDWKITRKLTANLGVRWDMYEPSVEVHNHAGWMNPGLANPDAGGILGAAQFATSGMRSDTPTAKKDFSPRIGFAYAWDNKTVIRSSFGILFAPGGYLGASVSNYNQGFNGVDTLVNASNGVNPDYILQNGWPSVHMPYTVNTTPSFALGSGIQRLDPQDARPPYMISRVLQIQRQLPSNMLLSVAYVGNHGTRLQSRIDVDDEMPPQFLSLTVPATAAEVAGKTPACQPAAVGADILGTCAAFPKLISDPRIQALPVVAAMPIDSATGNHSPFKGYEALLGGGATLGQALRTFPQYVSMRRLYEGDGKSDYNALQVNLNKRLSDGLTMLVSYTWSKTLTNAASEFDEFSGFDENSFNARPQKALSINDYPQNAVISFSYELPFGPGKKFIPQGGPAGKIVGGWRLSGVLNYQSGPPQLVYEGNALSPYEGNNDNGDGFALPNIVPGQPIKNPARNGGAKFDPSEQSLLNPAAFAITPNPTASPGLPYQSYFGDAPATLGGAGRRLPYFDEDISLIKRTNVTERVNVEFRADFLNIFNRTVFGLGTGGDMYGSILANGVGSSSFGVMSSQSNTPREIQFGLKLNF